MSSNQSTQRSRRPNRPTSTTTLDLEFELEPTNEPPADGKGWGSTAQRLSTRDQRHRTDHERRRTCGYRFCSTDFFLDPPDEYVSISETWEDDDAQVYVLPDGQHGPLQYPVGYDDTDADSDGYDETYCSEACCYYQKGVKALRGIEFNHTYCASCFREIKELEPPGRGRIDPNVSEDARERMLGKDIPGWVTERQYYRPPVTTGVWKTAQILNVITGNSGPNEPRTRPTLHDIVHEGGGCICGAGHHATIERPDRITMAEYRGTTDEDDRGYLPRLIDALHDRQAKGLFDESFSTDKLYDVLDELTSRPSMQNKADEQLAQALGEAIRYSNYSS